MKRRQFCSLVGGATLASLNGLPDRPFDPGASVTVQTQQLLRRVAQRLVIADCALVEHVNAPELFHRFDSRGLDERARLAFFGGHRALIRSLQVGDHRGHEAAGFAARYCAVVESH